MRELATTLTSPEPQHLAHAVVMATLNVNGLPAARQDARTKSLLPPYQARHRAICGILEASDIDIINLQEVFTHQDRRLFQKHLPSFSHVAFEWSPLGPKGALMTFSRLPLEKVSYESFFSATRHADRTHLPRTSLAKSALKGVLTSRLTTAPLAIINTHPLANDDWDWRPTNRFHELLKAQLGQLARSAMAEAAHTGQHVVLAGDLNTAKASDLFAQLLSEGGLSDAFAGDNNPTFHGDFLDDPTRTAHLDALLTTAGVTSTNPTRFCTGRTAIEGYGSAYLTDHQGLQARLEFS